jgi:serine/threonine protein kinase
MDPLEFPPEIWEGIDTDATDLITKMLNKSSEDRITMHEALSHPFITKYAESA